VFATGPRTNAPAAEAGQALGADGSRVFFRSAALDARGLRVESPALGALKLRRDAVAEIRFRKLRTVFLSDLTPAEATHTPFFDDEFPWRRDTSVSGQPLRLDGTTYGKGPGLHARTRLVFGLGGEYRRLLATAGIDDELGAGSATLTFLDDDKPLADRLPLDRTTAPRKIDLDIRGVESLTVLADFAEGTFGSGARVSLCDAVLAK
jgi:hypothetical protein